jgi:hypothetical protein
MPTVTKTATMSGCVYAPGKTADSGPFGSSNGSTEGLGEVDSVSRAFSGSNHSHTRHFAQGSIDKQGWWVFEVAKPDRIAL